MAERIGYATYYATGKPPDHIQLSIEVGAGEEALDNQGRLRFAYPATSRWMQPSGDLGPASRIWLDGTGNGVRLDVVCPPQQDRCLGLDVQWASAFQPHPLGVAANAHRADQPGSSSEDGNEGRARTINYANATWTFDATGSWFPTRIVMNDSSQELVRSEHEWRAPPAPTNPWPTPAQGDWSGTAGLMPPGSDEAMLGMDHAPTEFLDRANEDVEFRGAMASGCLEQMHIWKSSRSEVGPEGQRIEVQRQTTASLDVLSEDRSIKHFELIATVTATGTQWTMAHLPDTEASTHQCADLQRATHALQDLGEAIGRLQTFPAGGRPDRTPAILLHYGLAGDLWEPLVSLVHGTPSGSGRAFTQTLSAATGDLRAFFVPEDVMRQVESDARPAPDTKRHG